VAVPLAVVVAAALVYCGVGLLRRLPATSAPWWTVVATVVVAVGFAWFAVRTRSENVLLRRDAGAYADIGYWLAHHTGRTYQAPTGAFGPSAGDLVFHSPAFFDQDGTLVPQFMTGWPTALAGAGWVAGWHGILALPPLVGAFGILAVAGLVARLVGPRWAP